MDDKGRALKESARKVFSEKGYKAASIAKIARGAHVAVGSFYNYYPSKDEVFLDVYIEENDRVRQQIRDEIDWSAEPSEMVEQLFARSFALVSRNKILSEWGNPAISGLLHEHYQSREGLKSYPFHQFLVQTFTQRMREAGFDGGKIQQALHVYDFFFYVDTHVSEDDFPGLGPTLEVLASYFVKGLFE
ncbi:TetR/AcrR family transcriptional regulator [Thermophilibacter immobilis]|uniref:TetR/AcrR family transcriptional regulator n=1 Tax=Thermophilibacter immobilis TaxID=2779519 RepID=A0A7S7M950_9ACTN|nr:TetR/AcrR family transcriptional regulator [Thermophilibacter immobilis]QOY61032.1 TetR/AcrR family transcriptional regulator [Thermophilibacter immobilis]